MGKLHQSLKIGSCQTSGQEDELIWASDPFGIYTPKSGYVQLNLDLHLRDPEWWWKGVWKLKYPPKSKIFLWCLLVKKVLTWDIMKKRQIEGPGWCSLCKCEEESQAHLFLFFPFSKAIWQEISQVMGRVLCWNGN
jgi:hypothetical protein